MNQFELSWLEEGTLPNNMHSYQLSRMEKGSSPTPPPYGSQYYLNPKEENTYNEEEKQLSQSERNKILQCINEKKMKKSPKKIELPKEPKYPVSEEEAEKEYEQCKAEGLTFGGKRKTKRRKTKRKSKKTKSRRRRKTHKI